MRENIFLVFVDQYCRENNGERDWIELKNLPLKEDEGGGAPRGFAILESEAMDWCKQYNQSTIDNGLANVCCVLRAFYIEVGPLPSYSEGDF